jgi:hypothetical protein
MAKYVVRGEYPQRNRLRDGFGSEAQSPELSTLEQARQFARTSSLHNKRIYEVKGTDGSKYPLVERVK